jgi:nitrogen-specific signal transduction histidine kinase
MSFFTPRTRGKVSTQVVDKGPGVNDPAKVFERFISAKKKGIGLAVSPLNR